MKANHTSALTKPNRDIHNPVRMSESKIRSYQQGNQYSPEGKNGCEWSDKRGNPHGLHVNLRTVLGGIFNSAALSGLRRQLVNVAVHPGGSNR
jgi:hypothetical protein